MNKYWYQEQVRILQTVLREKDAAQYDAAAVVRYMKETDSNCLVVNAGGVMDFFPNKTELGRPGRFLGSQDILKSLVKECHENQLRIIAISYTHLTMAPTGRMVRGCRRIWICGMKRRI